MRTKMQTNGTRVKNWALIIYPESAPANWRDIICEIGAPWANSPLHDKDVDVNGCLLKPHYHVVIKFSLLKSYQQMLKLTGKLCAPNPQRCESLASSVIHFTHENYADREKYQYDKKDIETYNRFDLVGLLKPTKTEKHAILKALRAFSKENDITELEDLYDYTDEKLPYWSKVMDDNPHIMNNYLHSRRFRPSRRKKALLLEESQLESALCLPTITTNEEYKKSLEHAELKALTIKEYQESYECQYSVQE